MAQCDLTIAEIAARAGVCRTLAEADPQGGYPPGPFARQGAP